MNTAPVPGIYDVANTPILAQSSLDLSGTTWAEDQKGDLFFLECSTDDGNAIDEVLEGKGVFKSGVAPTQNTVDTSIVGRFNNPTEPYITWIACVQRRTVYRVLAVLSDNLIQVDVITGVAPTTLTACVTRGLQYSNVTVSADGGDVEVFGYHHNAAGSGMVIPDGTVKDLKVDLHCSGPLFFVGTGHIKVDV